MKLLWLCNIAPAVVQEKLSGKAAGGLWLDHVAEDIRRSGITLRILCPGEGTQGTVDEMCTFATFREGLPEVYLPELEQLFELERKTCWAVGPAQWARRAGG